MAKSAKAAARAPRAKAAPPNRVSMKMIEFTPATAGDALANAGAARTGKLTMVAPEQIHIVPGFNLRVTETPEYKEGIRELADSIKSEGYYDSQPLGVFPAEIDGEAGLALISGHRRYEAALLAIAEGADITRLPVVLKRPGSSDLDLAMSLHKENTHVRPTILERAVLANRLMKIGMDDDEIASRLGVTNRHIRDLKTIINAPKGVRDLIRDGKIAASEAILGLRKDPTGNKIMEAAAKADERAMQSEARKAEKLTRKTLEGGGEKPPRNTMTTTLLNFAVKAGVEFLYEDVEPFMALIEDDETWFKGTRSVKKKIALSDIEFDVKIKRAKTADELAAEDATAARVAEEKAAAKAAKTAGRKAPVATDDELGPDEEEDDLAEDDLSEAEAADAPDLRALGIAEPATGEL
jgi:hypothetical protein